MKRGIVFQIVFLTAIFLIISVNFISAAVTVVNPLTNSNFSGSAMFNVTYVNGTDLNWTATLNASFYYTTNISASWTFLGNVSCSSGLVSGNGYCNGTLSIASIEGSNLSINATINSGSITKSASVITTNVTLDSRAPNVTYITVNRQNVSKVVVINVSVVDGRTVDSVWINITNSTGAVLNFTRMTNLGGTYYNYTLDTTGLTFLDGLYNITILANDSQVGNMNSSEKIQVTLDNTVPTGTLSCTPTSTSQGQTITCTCTPTDGGTGINSASYTSSYSVDTNTVGNNTNNCTFYDLAGNLGSAVFNYTVTAISVATPSSTPGTTSQSNSFNSILPGNTSIIGNLDSSIGVQEVRIDVSSQADNVRISFVKYDEKPTNVSVVKSGIYQYFQIQTQNLASKLSTAKIEIRVKKSWFSLKSLTKDDVALFKYNENSSRWDELTTTYSSEDTTNYYYNVSVSSFSYFAIAQKEAPASNQSLGTNNENTTPAKDLTWVWATLAGVVGVAILVVAFLLIRKKKKGY